ncbi:MAG: SRPBCC family protein [Pseudomonadota bacterium]
MTTLTIIIAAIFAIAALSLLLPRRVSVSRSADVPSAAQEVLARAASTEGFQSFNPYASTDPTLKITAFGPSAGVGAGFRFEGKEGNGTQTVTQVTDRAVTYQIDLGAMGKPVQVISAQPTADGTRVTWTVTSDLGYNPVFRIFGLFMDRMLGKTYDRGLKNLAQSV